jgi:coenzyme F420-0:L-glutamate ligase/coenzyme F420-1:gamma-L-glutamate ligase
MPHLPVLQLIPVTTLPEIRHSDDLAALLFEAAATQATPIVSADIVVVAQKIVSKAEGRRIALADISPSPRARELAAICEKDPRLVELVLSEAEEVVRCIRHVLIVRHRLGMTVANAGIDQSNIEDGDGHALLLPVDPDGSAATLHQGLSQFAGGPVGVVINDSFGRPWRKGTCGTAIGCAGVESLVDLRGRLDRFGRPLRSSELGRADEIAAAASLVMGQAAEGVPAVILRGMAPCVCGAPAAALIRKGEENLFT